ncbi:MAG: sensor histidine kinase [Pirellulales bacterium]
MHSEPLDANWPRPDGAGEQGAAPTGSRLPWRTLRFQLTAWNSLVVLLTVIFTLIGVREGLRLTLRHENDATLADDLHEAALAVQQFYPDLVPIEQEMRRKSLGHADRQLVLQLLDGKGRLIASSGDAGFLMHEPPAAQERLLLKDVGGYRLVQRRLVAEGHPELTLRVAASLRLIQDDLGKLTRLMAFAGVVILFLAPVGGYFLARRSTQPIAQIISTTARLRPWHMEERLPMRGTNDELDQLSRTINRFLDRLADYLDRNREFVANAAHELRSPLAAIQSSVEVTLNMDRSTEEYQDLLVDIAGECGQLSVLVNQLLLLAEADAATTEPQRRPVRLDSIVARCIDMFSGAAEDRGLALLGPPAGELTLLADGNRLRQVINNLIDNGLKFTPRGGTVRVNLHRDAAANRAIVSVSDDGPGIEPDDLQRIFERFYRADKSRQRDAPAGNGLGLSICQAIVAAHGGTIEAASQPGKGTTFTVRLPLDYDQTATTANAPAIGQLG